ncbi:MAG: phosphoribosylanthranilate isomerase [Deltaproteobacteria bacterium]|nr:phosphoribosylanthranilate isomerase [Deltaproteobacteria bacterium]
MVRIKICGITNLQDAMSAVYLGVDALGFIFAPSPREISPREARMIIEKLPPLVKSVGVFVNEKPEEIERISGYCGLDLVQLHGDEPPEECKAFMPRTIKAIQVRRGFQLSSLLKPYQDCTRAILLDTYSGSVRGGTGHIFDWNLAAHARDSGMSIILSGGLNPANVREAVLRVRPHGVDVNSGIEEYPGKKDFGLMKKFMDSVRCLLMD